MLKVLHNLFTKHPNSINLTYFEHLILSLSFSLSLSFASLKAFIHAIFPFIFITSTTDTIYNIDNQLNNHYHYHLQV